MQKRQIGLLALAAFSLIAVNSMFFTVSEGTQALITQFGEIKGEPITKAGMHFKLPFIHDVRTFDRRILSWDGDPEQIPTKDKKYIWVDTTARWRIKDLRKFAETVQSEIGARNRLDAILDGVTRDTISNHNLVEEVRNSNTIFEHIAANKSARAAQNAQGGVDEVTAAIEEEVTGEIEKIMKGREQLSNIIVERSRSELAPFGIELIDVQLRRIAYEKSVEDKVYERMISERNRVAEKIRSIGKGAEARIKGTSNRDLKEIESEAFRKAQEIKGVAEAKASLIYSKAMQQDPEYYSFIRTLEAYRNSIPQKGQLIMSTNADFLRMLEKSPTAR
ncbi:MAG: protease modulator HflC [Proteobacteria bacterium]|nr:protease modulator HflC [Pseudomonadota bacterium]